MTHGEVGNVSAASSGDEDSQVVGGSGLRYRVGQFVDGPKVQTIIIGVIVVNALILGLLTSKTVDGVMGDFLRTLDTVCLAIFTVEIALRLYAQGFRFFKGAWNVFDFFVVAVSLLPASPGLSVLRALRVLRVLRLVTRLQSLRMVVRSLLSALPGVGTIFCLLALVYYVAGVIATNLFGEVFPEWFGTLGLSVYTLFQVMTLESWSMGISRPVMAEFPYAWIFFMGFILATTFTVLNLFIAVIVNAMSEQHEQELAVEQAEEGAKLGHPGMTEGQVLLLEIQALRSELRDLRDANGTRQPAE